MKQPCTLCGMLQDVWFHSQGLVCSECSATCKDLGIPLREPNEGLAGQVKRLLGDGFPKDRFSNYIKEGWMTD